MVAVCLKHFQLVNTGRIGGVAQLPSLLSYPFSFIKPTNGGCNIYDQTFGLGSTLVLGIVLGSFLTAVAK